MRVELWWREAVVPVARSVAAGALVALVAIVLFASMTFAMALVLVTVAIGLVFAALRRPTRLRAARQADQQSGLRNRLATAVEILEGRIATNLSELALIDTSRAIAGLPASRAFPRTNAKARNASFLAIAAIAVVSLVVVFRPVGRGADTGVTSEAEPAETSPTPVAEATPSTETVIAPQQLGELRARSAAEQAAIAQLAEQLQATAAAREIGQALQRGDVTAASAELNQLARDSDQLSQTAKQELAGALLNASKGTAALDKNLAAAELAATVAMTRSSYTSARGALQGLAAALLDAQNGTLTQQQLIAQIQQLERDVAAQTGGNGTDCGVLTDDGEFFQDCSAVGQAPSSGAMGVVSRGTGASPTGGVGEVPGGHGFATSGVDIDPLGQAPTHLDLPTADVPVDIPPSNGQGNGATADPNAATLAISQSSQSNVQQPGGQQSSEPVRQPAEQTIVSPADRGLVRSFFQPTEAAQP